MNIRLNLITGSLIATVAMLSACHHHTAAPADTHGEAGKPAHWSYTGESNPANWAKLSGEYHLCATGTCQSPINVAAAEPKDLDNPVFDYRTSAVNIINNGHTVQVNCDPDSSLKLEGKSYKLTQFHFHAPSEHRVNGQAYPVEMHLVHQADDGTLAVIGLLIATGRENAALAPVFSQLPSTPGPAKAAPGTINIADVLPATRTSFRYGGSLTTPPCSERVAWTLLTTPIELSASQIKAFTSLYNGNNRPVQPLNNRFIVEDVTR